MKKVVVVLLFGILFASVAWAEDGNSLLKFKTMVAVTGPFVGTVTPQTPIQGVNGAGRPWVISEAQGELKSNGELEVRVRGLVLASSLKNPLANFRAVLSCHSTSSTGDPTVVTVSTDNFPASPEGDAEIKATINIPSPCFAPILFVTTPPPDPPRWLAVTGQ
jgi:hypothetical protein